MENIDKDVQLIIDKSFYFAEESLNNFGFYDPFAITINLKGEIIPYTFERAEGQEVDTELLIDELDTVLSEQLENKEILAYGLGYEIQTEINEEGDISDALLLDLTHEKDDGIPYYFFPHKIVQGKAVFGESFGMER